MERMYHTLKKINPNFNQEDWDNFSSIIKKYTFKKGALISTPKKVVDELYFIDQGLLKYYHVKEDKELVLDFGIENEFSTDFNSFFLQIPSRMYISSLTKVTLFAIKFDDLQKLFDISTNTNTIGRKLAENRHMKKSQREFSLLAYSATERYQNLKEQYKTVPHRIPLKDIASYLGIEPQSLSRIRRNMELSA